VTEIADDGWYGDPRWANEGLAQDFAATLAEEIVGGVESILKLRDA
jgi:hypothetical protein